MLDSKDGKKTRMDRRLRGRRARFTTQKFTPRHTPRLPCVDPHRPIMSSLSASSSTTDVTQVRRGMAMLTGTISLSHRHVASLIAAVVRATSPCMVCFRRPASKTFLASCGHRTIHACLTCLLSSMHSSEGRVRHQMSSMCTKCAEVAAVAVSTVRPQRLPRAATGFQNASFPPNDGQSEDGIYVYSADTVQLRDALDFLTNTSSARTFRGISIGGLVTPSVLRALADPHCRLTQRLAILSCSTVSVSAMTAVLHNMAACLKRLALLDIHEASSTLVSSCPFASLVSLEEVNLEGVVVESLGLFEPALSLTRLTFNRCRWMVSMSSHRFAQYPRLQRHLVQLRVESAVELPGDVGTCQSLKALSLVGCRVETFFATGKSFRVDGKGEGSPGGGGLSAAISAPLNVSVTDLDLTESHAAPSMCGFDAFDRLRRLRLDNATLTRSCVESLARCQRMESLSLSSAQSVPVDLLLQALKLMPLLRELDVSTMNVKGRDLAQVVFGSSVDVASVGTAVPSALEALEWINISMTNVRDVSMLSTLPHLRTIISKKTQLGPKLVLSGFRELRKLVLDGCDTITDLDVVALPSLMTVSVASTLRRVAVVAASHVVVHR
jgi:hypothetical protein